MVDMVDEKLCRFGRYFWIVTSGALTVIFSIYMYQNGSLFPFPVIIYMAIMLSFEYQRKYTGRVIKYYPTNLKWYVVENTLFFCIFLGIRVLLGSAYAALQAIYVLLMFAIVIFNTYALLKVYRLSEASK